MAQLFAPLQAALADRYAIERELGRGGMATVYLAHDLKHDRLVALKVLRPELAAALGPERFEREIKVAARLRHSHILTVYDSGDAAGQLWFTMPYVDGETLRERLTREQQLPLEEAVQIALEVADALAYAHRHDVVHRDIKPENILLEAGHAVVADFGIARVIGAADDKRLTETGLSVGTPSYMSPEQATGSKQLDGRTDIYSLGCVLYEMLAGDPPFTGTTAQAVIARHLVDPPPRLRTVRQTVSPQLEQALEKALAKVPADRFATAAAFGEALKTASIEPAMPQGRPIDLAAIGKRFWARAIAVGVALVTLIGGVWTMRYWWAGGSKSATASGEPALDPRHIAVLYFEDVSEHHDLQYLADGLTETLISDMKVIQPLQVRSRFAVAPYRGKRVPVDSIVGALGVGTVVQGQVARVGDLALVTVALINGATGAELGRDKFEHSAKDVFGLRNNLYQDVLLLLKRGVGVDVQPLDVRSETRSAEAWELVQRAATATKTVDSLLTATDTAAAFRALAQADSLLAQASGMDREWVLPIVNRGWVAYEQRKIAGWELGPASKWTRLALEFAAQAFKMHPGDLEALRLRGTVRYISWRLHLSQYPLSAQQLLDSAEADLRAAAVPSDPDQAPAWSILSHLLLTKGDLSGSNLAALWAYEADPYLADANNVMSRALEAAMDRGEAAQAIELCREGRRRFPKDYSFTLCQLHLMAFPGQKADVNQAWRLLEELGILYPPNRPQYPPEMRDFWRRNNQMFVALVLAKAGLKDSADHVFVRSRGDSSVDPERWLAYVEAELRNLLGERDESLRLLGLFLEANPTERSKLADFQTWWWRGVHDDPRFKELVGSGARD